MSDSVNHPSHYTSVVPGIECIDVVEHFSFLRGNAIKYLWRAGAKGDLVTDLRKAAWYIQREIDAVTAESLTAISKHEYVAGALGGTTRCHHGRHGQRPCELPAADPIHGAAL